MLHLTVLGHACRSLGVVPSRSDYSGAGALHFAGAKSPEQYRCSVVLPSDKCNKQTESLLLGNQAASWPRSGKLDTAKYQTPALDTVQSPVGYEVHKPRAFSYFKLPPSPVGPTASGQHGNLNKSCLRSVSGPNGLVQDAVPETQVPQPVSQALQRPHCHTSACQEQLPCFAGGSRSSSGKHI